MDESIDPWGGVHLITVTPFTADGASIDVPTLERHLAAMADAGLETVVVGGNTSEYLSMSPLERRRSLDVAVACVGGRMRIIAGIGADTEAAAGEARDAEIAGADAVMVHTPPHPFVTNQGWIAYHDRIGAAIDIPVFPYVRDGRLDPGTIAAVATRPYARGIKYAVPNPVAFGTAVSLAPDRTWICGSAERWAPTFWSLGAVGFTSGLANVRPWFSLRFLEAQRRDAHREVRRLWAASRAFEDLRSQQRDGWNVAVVKYAMGRTSRLDPGPVRLPATPIPPEMQQEVVDAVRLLDDALASEQE